MPGLNYSSHMTLPASPVTAEYHSASPAAVLKLGCAQSHRVARSSAGLQQLPVPRLGCFRSMRFCVTKGSPPSSGGAFCKALRPPPLERVSGRAQWRTIAPGNGLPWPSTLQCQLQPRENAPEGTFHSRESCRLCVSSRWTPVDRIKKKRTAMVQVRPVVTSPHVTSRHAMLWGSTSSPVTRQLLAPACRLQGDPPCVLTTSMHLTPS